MKTKINHKFVLSVLAVGAVALMLAQAGALPARGATGEPPKPKRNLVLPSADLLSSSLDRSVITFQGRLTSAIGQPINTPVQATFRIYTDVNPAVATTPTWISSLRTITPTNGLFTVYLGEAPDTALDVNVQAGAVSVLIAPDTQEMTPRQVLNGVFGHGYIGVTGNGNYGVYGVGKVTGVTGTGMVGVSGYTYDTNIDSSGVWGGAFDKNAVGVRAYNSVDSGAALAIEGGAIKVRNAGQGSPTTAYIHVASASNIGGNITTLDNPILNNNPNALVFVTHNQDPGGIPSGVLKNLSVGVYYSTIVNKWTIFNEDGTDISPGASFNVLIIVP